MNAPTMDEWDVLSAEWRAAPDGSQESQRTAALVERLRARVLRRTWLRVGALALEVLLSTIVVAWSLGQLPRAGLESWALRIGICAFTAMVWAFGLWNRRHGWRAEGRSSSDFVRLSRQRLVEARRSIRFVRVTLGVATAVCVPWFAVQLSRGAVRGGEQWLWALFAVYVVAMMAWCHWYALWIAREEGWLESMERDLS